MNPNLFCIRASHASNFVYIDNINDMRPANIKEAIQGSRDKKNLIIVCENGLYKIFNFSEYIESINKKTTPFEIQSYNDIVNFDARSNLLVKMGNENKHIQVSDDGKTWSNQGVNTNLEFTKYKFVSPLIEHAYCYSDKKLHIHDYKNIIYKTKLSIPEENLIGMVASEYDQSILHRFLDKPTGIGFYIEGELGSADLITDYFYEGCVNSYEELPKNKQIRKSVYKVKKQNSFFILNEDSVWTRTFPVFKLPYKKRNMSVKSISKKIITFFYTDKTLLVDLSDLRTTVFPKLFLLDYLQANKSYVNCEIVDYDNSSIMGIIGEVELIDNLNKKIILTGVWSHGYKSIIPLYFDQESSSVKSCISGDYKVYEYLVTDKHNITTFFSESGYQIPANSFNLTHDEYQIWNMLNETDKNLNISDLLENEIHVYPGCSKYVRYISL